MDANEIVDSKNDDRETFYDDYAYASDDKGKRKKAETLIKILKKSGFNDDEIEEDLMTVILTIIYKIEEHPVQSWKKLSSSNTEEDFQMFRCLVL
ncbi:hypothetical protein PVAND_013206 [Polypedilum vanderplanki]|uniref:Uncharacterized protein n=1 Tax=Polypedilum vanderplanki TaxID=319348 RepID=A0A9J6CQR0_POLVA|nr:hypothetical protein PVAND_013206 [Polypedilum vanderplanki]